MAVSLATALLLFIAVVIPLLHFRFSSTKKSLPPHGSDDRRQLPPSPRFKVPLLGHQHLLMRGLPHRTLRSLAVSYGPILFLSLGRVPTVVVSSAAAAEEVLKTRDLDFASRPRKFMLNRFFYNSNMGLAPYGEYWRRARRVGVVHLLNARRIISFRPVREEAVAEVLGRIHKEARENSTGSVNLSESLLYYTRTIIMLAAFGSSDMGLNGDDGEAKFRLLLTEFMELLGTTPMREVAPWLGWVDTLTGLEAKAKRTFEVLDAFLERIVAEHLSQRGVGDGDQNIHRDFVDTLLHVNEMDNDAEFQLSTDNIKGLILEMFSGGTETSYTVLEWAMAELINHPHEMQKLQDEVRTIATAGSVTEDHLSAMPYLKAVISEVLRLHPPAPLLVPHETTKDTELLGYHVPAGTQVIINAWAIGRDPRTWERADEFAPERFMIANSLDYCKLGQDFRFLPFGAGRRGCPGAGFAAPSIEIALANILYRFDWEPLNRRTGTPSPVDTSEAFGISVRLKTPLLLVAKPWNHDAAATFFSSASGAL